MIALMACVVWLMLLLTAPRQHTLAQTAPTLVPTLFQTQAPTATPAPVGDGVLLLLGQTLEGSINAPGQRDRFVVFAPYGTVISLGMFAGDSSRLVPRLEVYAPNGEVVSASSQPTGAVISGYTVPVTGAYIVLASANANRTRGAYFITAATGIAVRDLPRGQLTLDGVTRGELARVGDRDVYAVDLPPLARLSVEVSAYQSGIVPVVELVDPAGNLLARAGATPNTGGRVMLAPSLTSAGRYQVRISGFQAQTTGSYLLTVRLLNQTS